MCTNAVPHGVCENELQRKISAAFICADCISALDARSGRLLHTIRVGSWPHAMAVDTLDKCGVYFGTTGGQVYASADGGDSWAPIVRDLPAVLSVEAQTLP